MLYFSKLRIIIIITVSLILSYFAFSNFINSEDKFLNKKINLGLDLQGGSYLLLEVDNSPIINQKLQSKLLEIRKFSKSENINLKNLILINNKIEFNVLDNKDRSSSVTADNVEFRNIATVNIGSSNENKCTVLFDSKHSIEDKILNEQFNF